MLRITPDTNVLVRGTISPHGAAGQVLATWVAGNVALVTCAQIVEEYQDVLTRPHIRDRYRHVTPATIAVLAAALRHDAILVTLADVPPVITKDPDDDVVLACAVSGGVDFIISGDPHVLGVKVYQGIPIVTAEAFLPILRGGVREERATFVASGAAV